MHGGSSIKVKSNHSLTTDGAACKFTGLQTGLRLRDATRRDAFLFFFTLFLALSFVRPPAIKSEVQATAAADLLHQLR
jgi:hypothetical protein